MPTRDVIERAKVYATISAYAAGLIAWVFSALVAAYGLFTHQGDDFYNKSPWGFIAFPGYFLLFGAILGALWGLGALGWQLILALGGWTRRTNDRDARMAWFRHDVNVHSAREKTVLQVVGWTTGLVGALLVLWGEPFLPSGILHVPAIVVITVGTGVLLLRGWTTWQRNPLTLGAVSAGVAAGILVALAYHEATRPTHDMCVNGVGGRDPECFEYEETPGPDMGNAAMLLFGAGFVVVAASSLAATSPTTIPDE